MDATREKHGAAVDGSRCLDAREEAGAGKMEGSARCARADIADRDTLGMRTACGVLYRSAVTCSPRGGYAHNAATVLDMRDLRSCQGPADDRVAQDSTCAATASADRTALSSSGTPVSA